MAICRLDGARLALVLDTLPSIDAVAARAVCRCWANDVATSCKAIRPWLANRIATQVVDTARTGKLREPATLETSLNQSVFACLFKSSELAESSQDPLLALFPDQLSVLAAFPGLHFAVQRLLQQHDNAVDRRLNSFFDDYKALRCLTGYSSACAVYDEDSGRVTFVVWLRVLQRNSWSTSSPVRLVTSPLGFDSPEILRSAAVRSLEPTTWIGDGILPHSGEHVLRCCICEDVEAMCAYPLYKRFQHHTRWKDMICNTLETLKVHGWRLAHEGITLSNRQYQCAVCGTQEVWYFADSHLSGRMHRRNFAFSGLPSAPLVPTRDELQSWQDGFYGLVSAHLL